MPLYDYECKVCGRVEERFERISVRSVNCECGSIKERIISRQYIVPDVDVVTEDILPDRPVHISSRKQLRRLMEKHNIVEKYGKGWI